MTRRTFPIIGLGLVAAAAAIAYGGDADAAFNRQHASQCLAFQDGYWIDHDFTAHNNQPTDVNQEMMCPAPDTDVTPKYAWTTVNVETYIGSQYGVIAAICEDYWNGYGGACTASVVAPGNKNGAHETISLGDIVSQVWTPSGEINFGYIYVDVGAGDNVRGIYYSN